MHQLLPFLVLHLGFDVLDGWVAQDRAFVLNGVAEEQYGCAIADLHIQTDEVVWLVVEETLYVLVDPIEGECG